MPIDEFMATVLLDLVYLERDRLALQRARAPVETRPWFNRQINRLDRWAQSVVRLAHERAWQAALDVDARRVPVLREGEARPD